MTDKEFAAELLQNLQENILPYWLEKMADGKGGFYGRRDGYDRLHPDAPRGAILNARILWAFSAACRLYPSPELRHGADNAFNYIREHFIDPQFGGVYWSVDAQGNPDDTRKQFYAIAFTIYGLAEYNRLTGSPEALQLARKLFRDIEDHSRDRQYGGYIEACTREWDKIEDLRLSEKDENTPKSMNTHLHILEAYTALLRVWDDPELRSAHRELITLFLEKIEDAKNHHLGLFFDNDWRRTDHCYSYGHDIEASWLLLEAAMVNGEEELLKQTKAHCQAIAKASLEGLTPDGSMIYERHNAASVDSDRHWWVQAECVVGMLWLWKHHGQAEMRQAAEKTWGYIRDNLVDNTNGEWYWSRKADGTQNRREDKAGFWKCPYHNSRMHLEALTLLTPQESKSSEKS